MSAGGSADPAGALPAKGRAAARCALVGALFLAILALLVSLYGGAQYLLIRRQVLAYLAREGRTVEQLGISNVVLIPGGRIELWWMVSRNGSPVAGLITETSWCGFGPTTIPQ